MIGQKEAKVITRVCGSGCQGLYKLIIETKFDWFEILINRRYELILISISCNPFTPFTPFTPIIDSAVHIVEREEVGLAVVTLECLLKENKVGFVCAL